MTMPKAEGLIQHTCRDCSAPLTQEERIEGEEQCDLCADFFVGTFSLSDMLEERALRLTRIRAVVGRVETVGGVRYALVPFEDLETELARVIATMNYVASQIDREPDEALETAASRTAP